MRFRGKTSPESFDDLLSADHVAIARDQQGQQLHRNTISRETYSCTSRKTSPPHAFRSILLRAQSSDARLLGFGLVCCHTGENCAEWWNIAIPHSCGISATRHSAVVSPNNCAQSLQWSTNRYVGLFKDQHHIIICGTARKWRPLLLGSPPPLALSFFQQSTMTRTFCATTPGNDHSRKKRNMENCHGKLAVKKSAQAVDLTAGQSLGE